MSSTVIAGKPSNTVGEKDSVLILRGSSVKVQWGNKFIDLIKNGKINSEYDKILKTASSIDNIKTDGIYLVDDQIWIMINGTKVQLSGDNSTIYVSFTKSQETTEENKLTALKNIGFYYDSLEQAQQSGISSGIIYVLKDNKLYTIVDGKFTEYFYQAESEEKVEETLQKQLYIDQYSLWVDGDEYARFENNQITLIKQLITENGIYSQGATSDYGYRLYIKDGKSYLEVDEVIERDPSALNVYEFIKVYSEHNNIVKEALFIENDIQCVLQEKNLFKSGDYIYIVGSVEVDVKYNSGIITLTLNKESSNDIKGTLNGIEITIPAGTTQLYLAGSSNYELDLNIEKELFEYKIKESINQNILVENGDAVFYKNCKYVYSSRKPLIKIHNNNLSVMDRSIQIDNKPDETIHTRIGIVEEDNIEQLKEEFKELEDRPKVGVFSDNFIGLNPILYNSTFKTIRKDKDTDHPKYPVYDKEIDLPKDKLLIDDKFNYSVPDIEWIKRMLDLLIPIGTIVMFDGKSEIPPGWAICNGDQGTPNLIGRFIKADYTTGKVNPDGVDENNTIQLKETNLPEHHHPHLPHTHGMTQLSGYAHDSGSLSMSLNWNDYLWNLNSSTTSVVSSVSGEGITSKNTSVVDSVSASTQGGDTSGGDHNHSVTITGGEILENTSQEDVKVWTNERIKIEPRHYSLIFIMKVSNWYNNIK